MWTALLQAIGSFAAGAGAWVVLEFFGRPLRKFYDLRGETIYLLAQTSNVSARFKEIPDDVGAISGQVEALNVTDDQIADIKEAQKKVPRSCVPIPRLRLERNVCASIRAVVWI